MILTSVPLPSDELSSIPIPSLSHNFLHKYKPIPVDFLLPSLPLVPVKPLSNTFDNSALFMPMPLSFR